MFLVRNERYSLFFDNNIIFFAKMFVFNYSFLVCTYVCNMVLFSLDGSEGDYEEETELFEQECDDFMKEFVAKIFLEE